MPSALEGIWEQAESDYKRMEENSKPPASEMDCKHLFCLAYVFGTAFGLNLSKTRPDLVETISKIKDLSDLGWNKT